jgi:phage terminase large subunit-like protein
VNEARGMPANESIVRRLNFCEWREAAVHMIPMDKWDVNQRLFDPQEFVGKAVFGGLDIGATSDFTAFVLLFPDESTGNRIYTLRPYFWLPESPRRYDEGMTQVINRWRKEGFVRTTPGEVVDYAQVCTDILEIVAPYYLVNLAFDKGYQGMWISQELANHLGHDKMRDFSQGIMSMCGPTREFVELVMTGRMFHDGNPVMRWMAANASAETRSGLIKPSKDHSAEKIDGVTAAVMALGLAQTAPVQPELWIH